MTLINVIDVMIAQTERAMEINADNGAMAFADDDLDYYDKCGRFGRRLAILESKLRVARAEITDLRIHGCTAVTAEFEWRNQNEIHQD